MTKPISEIMIRYVVSAKSEDTVDKVRAMMVSRKLSSVPVVDKNDHVFGIISLIDLERFILTKGNPKTTQAWEICTVHPVEVGPEASTIEVAKLMVEKHIHHVMVVENQTTKGIVSSMDIVSEYIAVASKES